VAGLPPGGGHVGLLPHGPHTVDAPVVGNHAHLQQRGPPRGQVTGPAAEKRGRAGFACGAGNGSDTQAQAGASPPAVKSVPSLVLGVYPDFSKEAHRACYFKKRLKLVLLSDGFNNRE
jgi:hypothetical protein